MTAALGEPSLNGSAKRGMMLVKRQYPDPGDAALLRQAFEGGRVLVTIDSDFGTLIYLAGQAHSGLIRLPDVPARVRLALMARILGRYSEEELSHAIVTVRGSRIRLSRT